MANLAVLGLYDRGVKKSIFGVKNRPSPLGPGRSYTPPHQKRRTYLHIHAPPPLPGEVYYIHTGLTWYTDQAPQAAPLAPSIVIVSKTECVQKNEVSISVKLSSSVQTTHAMAAKRGRATNSTRRAVMLAYREQRKEWRRQTPRAARLRMAALASSGTPYRQIARVVGGSDKTAARWATRYSRTGPATALRYCVMACGGRTIRRRRRRITPTEGRAQCDPWPRESIRRAVPAGWQVSEAACRCLPGWSEHHRPHRESQGGAVPRRVAYHPVDRCQQTGEAPVRPPPSTAEDDLERRNKSRFSPWSSWAVSVSKRVVGVSVLWGVTVLWELYLY